MASKTAILAVRIIGDAASSVKAVREANDAVDGFEEHVAKVKDGVAVAGAAAGAALAAGVYGAVENAQVGNKLAGQLGLDPAESERLGRINGELFADAYGESLAEVAEASRQVIGNIDGMRDANDTTMRDITAKVLDVATTFDQDLGGTTTAIGQLMRTGMAPDAQAALDIITAGLQGNARASEDLIDTFTEYPALFQRLGLDGQTAVGLINQGLDAGARNTDLVADALKEFQIRATDGSTTSAAGFQALGLDAAAATAQIAAGGDGAAAGLQSVLDRLRGMEDPVAKNAAAVALFGTQAEDLGDALFALDPSSAVQGLGEVTGAAQRLDDTVGQDQGFEKLRRIVMTTFTDIGAAALPVLEPVLFVLQQFAPVLGPLALVVAAVAGAVAIYSGAMKVFAVVQAIQTAAQWASNAAWLASPITWIVLGIMAAIAGLVLIIVAIVKRWDDLRAGGERAFGGIVDAIRPVLDWLTPVYDMVIRITAAIGQLLLGGGFGGFKDILGGGELRARMTTEQVAAPAMMMRTMVAAPTTETTTARTATLATLAAAPTAPSISAPAAGAQTVKAGDTYNITLNGVIDRAGAAREIRKVMREDSRASGRTTVAGGVAW